MDFLNNIFKSWHSPASSPSAYARQIPALIPMERAGPKGYIRMVFPMALPASYSPDEVFSILRTGLLAAAERVPTIGCEGVPDPDSSQAGVLKLQRIVPKDGDDATQIITAKDLRDPSAFPHTYADLKAKGFPVEAFPDDLLCRRFTWPSPGEHLKVLDAQANFIRGGMLLTCCFFHVFGDGKAYYTWCETWAEECRRIQGLVSTTNEIPDVFFTDREKVMKPSGRNPGRPEDHPEIVVLPFTPPGFPPKMISREHVGQIFYLSPEARAQLKADAQPTDGWVSANDAFSALMWRSVMAAQFPEGCDNDDDVSIFNMAIDGRSRTDPPVHPRTLGCFLGWIAPRMPLRQILTSATLADVAKTIRGEVAKLNTQYTDDYGALVDTVEDVNRVVATAFLDVPGKNFVQTSWINFPLYNLDWGTKLGANAEAVRCPDVGVINGGSVVLPVMPDGGIEMIIGVEKQHLSRLLSDPLLLKYATPRVL